MSATDILGSVSDRLVGGMMFHSDHADLCRWLGVGWLADLHEEGYEHDSRCLRMVHRLGIRFCGVMVPDGRQSRSRSLDAYRQTKRWDVKCDVRESALSDAMHDWVDWENGTATMLNSAYRRLHDSGETKVALKVRRIATDTEGELAHARDLLTEMEAVRWDMTHVLRMCDS